MSYLCGSYLSGELTDEQAIDTALSNATSHRQIANYKKYYQQVAALSPAARANLAASLENILARLPAKTRNLVESMAFRTASYTDPRQATGLGNPAAAAGSTVSTIAAITGIVATLGTIGLQVATTLDQRKQQEKQSDAAVKTERANQAYLAQQIEAQRLANEETKLQLASKAPTSGPAIAPDGSLIMPSSAPTATQVGAGVALTAAAAYLLTR